MARVEVVEAETEAEPVLVEERLRVLEITTSSSLHVSSSSTEADDDEDRTGAALEVPFTIGWLLVMVARELLDDPETVMETLLVREAGAELELLRIACEEVAERDTEAERVLVAERLRELEITVSSSSHVSSSSPPTGTELVTVARELLDDLETLADTLLVSEVATELELLIAWEEVDATTAADELEDALTLAAALEEDDTDTELDALTDEAEDEVLRDEEIDEAREAIEDAELVDKLELLEAETLEMEMETDTELDAALDVDEETAAVEEERMAGALLEVTLRTEEVLSVEEVDGRVDVVLMSQ
ncbi:hypothetical protein F4778DRAFT_785911 [Xylariomycetidae sp. FL2044]|nr:hypothetical protein F4778DRAFT_785911 [Xylariomycetidae sp. FL2044]